MLISQGRSCNKLTTYFLGDIDIFLQPFTDEGTKNAIIGSRLSTTLALPLLSE